MYQWHSPYTVMYPGMLHLALHLAEPTQPCALQKTCQPREAHGWLR